MRIIAALLGLGLIFAVHTARAAGSPDLDYEAPDFWIRSYRIPATYQVITVGVTLPLEKQDQFVHRLKARGWKPTASGTTIALGAQEWLVPASDAKRLPSLLSPEASIDSFEAKAELGSIPEYPELRYKREILRRERSRLGLKRSDIPAIDGLLDAQLSTLARLIAAHERAKAIAAVIITINRKPIDMAKWLTIAGGPEPLAPAVAPPTSIWERSLSDTDCMRPPTLATATISVTPAQFAVAHEKLDLITDGYRRLGTRRPCEDGLTGYFLVPQDREPDLRTQLGGIGELIGWDRGEDPSAAEGPRAWRKVRLLRADLSAHEKELAKTPRLLSFVEAEVSRLEPAYEDYERLRSATAVRVRFVDKP